MTSEQLERWRHHASRTPSEMTNALFAHIDEQAKEISHSKELTKNNLEMIAEILEEYSELSSNHGCNDYWLPDTDKNWKLIQEIQRWNSSNSEDWDTRKGITSDRGLFIPHFLLSAYFVDKIEKYLAAGESDETES